MVGASGFEPPTSWSRTRRSSQAEPRPDEVRLDLVYHATMLAKSGHRAVLLLPYTMASDLLRHTVATLAYRAGKALRGAPPEFAAFKASPATRTPAEILAHMGDLLDWALVLADGKQTWHDSAPLPWDDEVARFFRALQALDDRLRSNGDLGHPAEKIFQGPLADALAHTGQIALLRRMAGSPVRGENYFQAEVAAGRVGTDQASPKREFE
jgi:hypothetical protein